MKCIFVLLAFLLTTCSAFAQSHVGDCSKKEGVEKARCERHEKMAEKCGPLKGEAHFVCDREFLLGEAEVKAFKTCEPKQSREFMKCVKETIGISPMGH